MPISNLKLLVNMSLKCNNISNSKQITETHEYIGKGNKLDVILAQAYKVKLKSAI